MRPCNPLEIETGSAHDRGVTVVEVLVAMLVAAVLSAIVITTFVSITSAIATAAAINRNTAGASNGMKEISRQIRAATANPISNTSVDSAIVQASNETLVIYAHANLQPSSAQSPIMVQLRVDPVGRSLIEDTWDGTLNSSGFWGFPSITSTPRLSIVLAAKVSQHFGANPFLFSYFAGSIAVPVPAGGSLTKAQRESITAIQVTLSVEGGATSATGTTSESSGLHPVTLQNTVGMPNVNP